MIAEGRVRHMAASTGATIDFAPIDYVAAGIVALAENMGKADGGRYHLAAAQPVPVVMFAAAIRAFPQFTAPLLVSPHDFDLAALPPFERTPLFARRGALQQLFPARSALRSFRFRAVTGLAYPPTGAAYLNRLIDYCISVGFLCGGAQASRS